MRVQKTADSIAAVALAEKKKLNITVKDPLTKTSGKKINAKDSSSGVVKKVKPVIKKIVPVVEEDIDTTESITMSNEEIKNVTIEGFFQKSYSAKSSLGTVKETSGNAAIFQSSKGWDDKKYYVLMNDLRPGTFVRISTAGNKFVYAKVLGPLPIHQENTGLLLRISDAAASALGFEENEIQPVTIYHY